MCVLSVCVCVCAACESVRRKNKFLSVCPPPPPIPTQLGDNAALVIPSISLCPVVYIISQFPSSHSYVFSLTLFLSCQLKGAQAATKKKGSVSLSAAELLYNPDLLAANRRQAWSQFGIDCSNSITCANGPCYYRCFFFLYDLFILNFRIYRNDMNPSLFASISVDRLSDTDPRCRSGRGA